MDFQKIFGERISQRRKELNLTQQQLGEEAGLSKQAINDIEHGRRSTLVTKAIDIARALDTTVEYLGGYTNNPTRPKDWARGSDPTLSVLISIADYFDVSLDYLVGRSDDPKRHWIVVD